MMGKVCSFFGHRNLAGESQKISRILKEVLVDLIEKGTDTFYVGCHGEFDVLASQIAYDLKTDYPQIQVILILCYAGELNSAKSRFHDFFFPLEVEMTPKRACIVKRNRWVIDNSDWIVSFVKYETGGAHSALEYARKHKKQIIEISQMD